MSRDDIQKLLGGYATGTLTPEEQRALYEAALTDQELFEALAREEPLRDALSDPAARARLLAALDDAPAPWYRLSWRPALLAMTTVLIVAGVAVWQRSQVVPPASVAKVELPRFRPPVAVAKENAPVLPRPPEVKPAAAVLKPLALPVSALAVPPPPATAAQPAAVQIKKEGMVASGSLVPAVPMMQRPQQTQQLREQFAPAAIVPLHGIVTDAAGSVVPSAAVTVQSLATGATANTSTNDRGEFTVQGTAGYQYQLSVSKPGFRTAVVNAVAPVSGAPAPVNVRLDIGVASNSVQVTADSLTVTAASTASTAPVPVETRALAGLGGGGGGRGGARAGLQWRLLRSVPGSDSVEMRAGGTVPKGSSLTLRVTPVADAALRIVIGDYTISADVAQGVASDIALPPFDKSGRVQIQLYLSPRAVNAATEEKTQQAPALTIPINIR